MKLDASVVGELLLTGEAERVDSERQLAAVIEEERARGAATKLLIEQMRADIKALHSEMALLIEQSHADLALDRAAMQSRMNVIEDLSKRMDETNRQLRALGTLVAAKPAPAAIAAPSAPAAIVLPKFVVERGLDGKVKALVPK